ncbi:MAG: uroporphyrinogen decarboxylase family protein [Bacteroidota bacterium]|nr:uroporphyrinogen decarboxylase family protein [Bacteroidota bacterium]
MTNQQWQILNDLVAGKIPENPVTGFIIDSPWLPGWRNISSIEYYSSERSWFNANKKAIETFPDTIFLPGFWSEFGMCSEPSAFGAKCIWQTNNLPHANRVITDLSRISEIKTPDPSTDGLLPFIIQRLKSLEPEIIDMGHEIKFAIARGPLNIASFLMGTSELMLGFMLQPDDIHKLLRIITDFLVRWLRYQKEIFPGIEGILLLDDIVGFIAEPECKAFAVPYIKEIFQSFDTEIRLFHNDAQGLVSTPFIKEMGVNIYNFSFEHSINEIRKLAGDEVVLLGNLPPRDVLAMDTPEEVRIKTVEMFNDTSNKQRIIWSCGGGMPPDVSSENITAFVETIQSLG